MSRPGAPLRRPAAKWSLIAGMGLLSASAIFPIYMMASNSFRSNIQYAASRIGLPSTLSFGAIRRAWTGASIPVYFRNSLVISICTVALSILLATMAGYSFSKLRWRLSRAVYLFLLVWIVVPPVILLVPLYAEMVQLRMYNTYWSVVLIYTALNLPFNVYLMTAYFRSLPDELVDAARVDGAGVHSVFFRVLVPIARPALATLVIFNFLWVWNEFLYALLLLPSNSTKTLTVGVLQLEGRFNLDPTALMAGLLIATLPVIGVFLVFQRHLVRAIAAGLGR